jgi:hypothetical protein
MMLKRKALVIFGSITGNTKEIAQEFVKVCESYGFQTDLVKVDPHRDWDKDPVFVTDYDLVCLGAPIIAGLPYKEVSMLMGLQGKNQLYKNRKIWEHVMKLKAEGKPVRPGEGEKTVPGGIQGVHYGTGIEGVVCPSTGTGTPGSKNEPNQKTIYGIAFSTYGGSGVGPEECYGTLEILTEFLRVNGARCVGKFACPGKELRHNSVDALASILKMNIDESQELMQRFKDHPDSEEFKKFSLAQMDTLKKMASVKDENSFGDDPMMVDNDPMGIGKPGSVCWHYDFQHRPSARDITKANIFLSEVIEDYFLTFTGDPRPPYSVYTSIS